MDNMEKVTTTVQGMLPGDVLRTGETIVSVRMGGIHTPSYKREVTMRRRDGELRTCTWNARTTMHITRPSRGWTVAWAEAVVKPGCNGRQSFSGQEAEARAVFNREVARATRGDVEFVLLTDPSGNCQDEWGT